MEEKRRAEVGLIAERFIDQPMTQVLIDAFCALNKFETVAMGELSDYIAQVQHDKIISQLFPEIIAEISKIAYVPEFASVADRKKIMESNINVRINVSKLFEKYALKYQYVDNISKELASMIGGLIEAAGISVFNKALEVLLHVAKSKFGGDFNLKHSADYAEEVIRKAKQ